MRDTPAAAFPRSFVERFKIARRTHGRVSNRPDQRGNGHIGTDQDDAVGQGNDRQLFRGDQDRDVARQISSRPCQQQHQNPNSADHKPGHNRSRRMQHRAPAAAIVSGLVICAIGILVLLLAWPTAYLTSDIAILISPKKLAIVALANSVVLVSAYVAVAALVWAVADAAMGAPRNLEAFDETPREGRSWRIAHLSDLHIVGGRYGFNSRAAGRARAATSAFGACSNSWSYGMRTSRSI